MNRRHKRTTTRSAVRQAALHVGTIALVMLTSSLATADTTEVDGPSQGAMYARLADGKKEHFVLEHTEVTGEVSGHVARMTVVQTFTNPLDEPVEAVYVFPLPDKAAVDGMSMTIGDRRVVAEIHKKEEARAIYEEARDSGKQAALLEQERPNVFTQSVANLMPGDKIHVELSYIDHVTLRDGEWEMVFPMVVGPRFIPGSVATGRSGTGTVPDTDRVADASRITPPIMPKGRRSGHDIGLSVRVSPGTALARVHSPSHDIDIDTGKGRAAVADVKLARHDDIPNKDFILRWQVERQGITAGLLSHKKKGEDGYFTLLVSPPEKIAEEEIVARELVFVVDCSGSMMGEPMNKVKEAMRRSILGMHPHDTFSIIRFSEAASGLAPAPLPNTAANRKRALDYIEALSGGGGTHMMAGIEAALDRPANGRRLRAVFFMTDGYIGNDAEVIEAVQRLIGDARLFSFGVGSSVNRYLLDRMARMGRGEALYVRQDEPADAFVDRFYRRISTPVLTSVRVDWAGLAVEDISPAPIPDLFDGQTLTLTGRYRKAGSGTIVVRGWAGGRKVNIPVEVELPDVEEKNSALGPLWARKQIEDIKMQYPWDVPKHEEETITALGLQFSITTPYTSFVAVEKRLVRDPDDPTRTVAVPVELPEGVSHEMFPNQVQPGDPILNVTAPKGTRSVRAVFEFGLEKLLTFDDKAGHWTTRFLIPAFVAEGNYTVDVLVERADGSVTIHEVPYRVDQQGPRLLPSHREVEVTLGEVAAIDVLVGEAGDKTVVTDGDVAVSILPERIRGVRTRVPDGRILHFRPLKNRPGHYRLRWKIRYIEPGVYDLPIEAVDAAANSTLTTIRVVVREGK